MRRYFRGIAINIAAGAFLAFGLYNVHARADITEGGILGLVLLLDRWLAISPSVSGFVLNAACYLFGARTFGRDFIVYSIAGAGSFSLSYAIFERFPPLLPSLSPYPFAAAIAGAVFVGVGVGVCVRIGGAPTGDDALAMSLSHIMKVPISRMYLASDLTVLALSLSYIPPRRIIWSLLTVILSGQIIELVQRIGKKKQL